ncbi:MAG: hypothetical protein ACFFCI_02505 [Promethearchaeota archaeon]
MIRNENSAFGFSSLTLGIVLVILHIIDIIIMEPFYVLMGFALALAMPIITVIYGIVGMVKDKKLVMAIIGLNCGLAPLIFFLIGGIFIST